jgi:uncharacterized protein YacL
MPNHIRIILRSVGFAFGILIGAVVGLVLTVGDTNENKTGFALLMAISIGGVGYLIGPYLKWDFLRKAKRAVLNASIKDIVAVAIGLGFGSLVAAPLAFIMSLLPSPTSYVALVAMTVFVIGSAVSVSIIRRDDLIDPWFKPKGVTNEDSEAGLMPLVLDTNIAIDGRVLEVIETGFLPNPLIVPRFVLDELQHIADSEDPQRRARGRRGLEILNTLRTAYPDRIETFDGNVRSERAVDGKLAQLALDRNAALLTNDFNLAKVAQMRGVCVLNLNELANSLRPLVNPGQSLTIQIVQEGREANQGVGFLDDGTMVVIDGGKELVGTDIPVTVTRLLQTGSGRMIFATPIKEALKLPA